MKKSRLSLDIVMTLLLLILMAYQVTGETLHEWIGVLMTLLVIIHHVLNRRWYGALFKGKYGPYRVLTVTVNTLLLAALGLTAFCGMTMSGHAVPFLYGMANIAFARSWHLAMSHWAFVLMGLHIGLHIPAMTVKLKKNRMAYTILALLFTAAAAYGLFLFVRSDMRDYMLFKVMFAFLDYDKSGALVLLENLLMLLFWVFFGAQLADLCASRGRLEKLLTPLMLTILCAAGAILLGNFIHDPAENGYSWNQAAPTAAVTSIPTELPAAPTAEPTDEPLPESAETIEPTDAEVSDPAAEIPEIDDGFILIEAGSFLMGSPETENWRIDDETQHEVTVSAFYIDPYETTQTEYVSLMGENPSLYQGDRLPVEQITWLDAIAYANAKSTAAGLTAAYTVDGDTVSWDTAADGYRLPTEAEWEYACRAGTVTPFNTEKSLSAAEANFYGHYPYEIEENYFNNSVLEARPGEYRGHTLEVGSFEPNAWGLYDCHGNVNEWTWDFYGEYYLVDSADPTGPETGTRHVYRGGGWNDFAKNMRSAYRAAGQADLASFNLGVRLVRNADTRRSGTVTAAGETLRTAQDGKVLIAFYSWGGNTRGIAHEIQRQTGADLLELTMVEPYSTSYNTVLMEAQEAQHRQDRPELAVTVENMEQYDVILLGYPNWWASIPMPIATFLESYDFTGKEIIPFCSHGGGRFGQSLTAIAKLAPDSEMGIGLSIHYSGGSTLAADVSEWLDANGITRQ